jgi:hypothetical protein
LGVGGALAGVMFWYYRQDRKDSEARIARAAERSDAIVERNNQAMIENSKALVRLSEVIESGETFSRIRSLVEEAAKK